MDAVFIAGGGTKRAFSVSDEVTLTPISNVLQNLKLPLIDPPLSKGPSQPPNTAPSSGALSPGPALLTSAPEQGERYYDITELGFN